MKKIILLVFLALPMIGFGQVQQNPKPPDDPFTTGATWFVIAIVVFLFVAIKNRIQSKN